MSFLVLFCMGLFGYILGILQGRSRLRIDLANALYTQAVLSFDAHGPADERGAAFWDAANAIAEKDPALYRSP